MNNIKVRTKLTAAFLFIIALMVMIGYYVENAIQELHEQDEILYEKGTVPLGELIDAAENAQKMRVYLRDWKSSKTEAERTAALKKIDEAKATAISIISKQYAMTSNKDVIEGFKKLEAAIEKYYNITNNFTKTHRTFCPNSGMSTDEFTSDVTNAASEMEKAMHNAIKIKVNAAKNLAEENGNLAHRVIFAFRFVMGFIFAAAIGLGLFLSKSIVDPLNIVVKEISTLENGDMTSRSNMNRKDEFGMLAKAVDNLASKLQNVFKTLHIDSDIIANASDELSDVSNQIVSGTDQISALSNTVASSTEQMSVNINAMATSAEESSVNVNDVAGSAEQMSTNMNTIASTIGEMSTSINQISNNTSEVRKIATDATEKAGEATEVMNKLGNAAKEIGQVTDVIKKIADKTNLLALNATIEAASAGEAGKGFAVVASEIKELANQSSTSAGEIAERIEGIQRETNAAIGVIQKVSDIITQINTSVETISGHIAKQTKASNEIATNVAQANSGAKRVASSIGEVAKGAVDVSKSASEASRGAHSVSQSIININGAVKEGAKEARRINSNASDLAKTAAEFKDMLRQYKV